MVMAATPLATALVILEAAPANPPSRNYNIFSKSKYSVTSLHNHTWEAFCFLPTAPPTNAFSPSAIPSTNSSGPWMAP